MRIWPPWSLSLLKYIKHPDFTEKLSVFSRVTSSRSKFSSASYSLANLFFRVHFFIQTNKELRSATIPNYMHPSPALVLYRLFILPLHLQEEKAAELITDDSTCSTRERVCAPAVLIEVIYQGAFLGNSLYVPGRHEGKGGIVEKFIGRTYIENGSLKRKFEVFETVGEELRGGLFFRGWLF